MHLGNWVRTFEALQFAKHKVKQIALIQCVLVRLGPYFLLGVGVLLSQKACDRRLFCLFLGECSVPSLAI